jgi:hypothetical protein
MMMTPVKSTSRYIPAAQTAAGIMQTVLGSLHGTDPSLIRQFVLTETRDGDAWLFAVVDDLRIQSYQPWVNALHALSTSLRGRPVFVSNTTGFRYAILLSDRPALPKEIPFQGARSGAVQLGMRTNGRPMDTTWDQLGHVLVAGQTQFGKSNFLRLLTMQARMEGYRFLLADLDGRTFSRMKGDQSLMLPIANTREGFEQVVNTALLELTSRVKLFESAAGQPDNLEEYNAQIGEGSRLSPVMVMLDEFSSVVLGMGGPKSDFAKRATEIAWRGLKFGIQVVLAGQDFSKDIVGPIREQMRTRLCFRVATADISDVVLGRRGAERIRQPGRAMMPTGMVQTYLVPKEALGQQSKAQGPQVNDAERKLIDRLWSDAEGKADLKKMMELGGMPERAARRLREDWAARGLVEKRTDSNNAWILVQTPWASKPVQTVSERPNGVQTPDLGVAA